MLLVRYHYTALMPCAARDICHDMPLLLLRHAMPLMMLMF